MSESGLHPIQIWLWAELDDLGIDGVNYSRHILDLLNSSKCAFDHRLDGNERNIFSQVAPSAKNRRHKSYCRSSSFSTCEEILCKKEEAVSCLLSAAETRTDTKNTQTTIQQVVDELYNKLAELRLTTVAKDAGFESDCYPLTDNVGKDAVLEKSEQKENYEDTFPSLDGSTWFPGPGSQLGSVWNNPIEKTTEIKFGHDSDNFTTSPQPTHQQQFSRPRKKGARRNLLLSYEGSRSESDVGRVHPLGPKNLNKCHDGLRKYRSASLGGEGVGLGQKKQQPKKSPHARYLPSYNHAKANETENRMKKTIEKATPKKRKFSDTKILPRKPENSTDKRLKDKEPALQNKVPEDFEIHLGHAILPSWLERALSDNSTADDLNILDEGLKQGVMKAANELSSSRWFGDPGRELAGFHEGENYPSSSSSASISHAESSLCEEEVCNFFKDVDPEIPPAPESWMWCPSPVVWEGGAGEKSPVSRLNSVYKRELMSLGAKEHANDISGRLWRDYGRVFQDLQEMDSGGSRENWVKEQTNTLWPPSSSFFHLGSDFDSSKYFPRSVRPDFGRWSEIDQTGGMDAHSLGRPVLHKSASMNDQFWHYSPTQKWSTEDDVEHDHPDEELATIMKDGVFGFQCPTEECECGVRQRKEQWQLPTSCGGDGSLVENTDTSELTCEEKIIQSMLGCVLSAELLGVGVNSCKKPPFVTKTSFYELNEIPHCCGFKKTPSKFSPVNSYRSLPHPSPASFPHEHSKYSNLSWRGGDLPHQSSTIAPPYPMHGAMPNSSALYPEKYAVNSWTRNAPDHVPMPTFERDECLTSLRFDVQQSFMFSAPIENFHSPDSTPLRQRWKMDDLFSHSYRSPLVKLKDLLASLETAGEIGPTYPIHGGMSPPSIGPYIGEGAQGPWRTAIKITNTQQAITGIRPVNVIYSEDKPGPIHPTGMIPSSSTHFRPISASLATEENRSPTFATSLSIVAPTITGPSEELGFKRMVHDKSMQTAFESSVQQELLSSCQQFVLPRPPKANSR